MSTSNSYSPHLPPDAGQLCGLLEDQQPNGLGRLAKEGFWIIAGKVLSVVGALAGVRILSELLSPTDYGELALGMTVAMLVNQVALGPLTNGATRFYASAKDKEEVPSYSHALYLILLPASVGIVCLSGIALLGLALSGKMQWSGILIAALLFAVLSGANSLANGIHAGARQRALVALHQGADSWARIGLAAGMIFFFGAQSVVVLCGYGVATSLIVVSQVFFLRKNLPKQGLLGSIESAPNWRSLIFAFSWPYSIWGIFTWAQLASDRWVIQAFRSTDEVGLYAVLLQVGYYPMAIATTMTIEFLSPILFQRSGDASDLKRNREVTSFLWKTAILGLAATALGFIVTQFLHEYVFAVIVAEEYRNISPFLPWILLSAGLFAAGQALSIDLASRLETQRMILPKIMTAVLGVGLNIIGGYYGGISGLVAASIAFSSVYLIWVIYLVKRRKNE